MTAEEMKRLEHAKRQYLLRINDTPIAILVDDTEDDCIAGCFEASSNGNPKLSDADMVVPISLKPIKDDTVLGYAHLMLMGILQQIKKEKKSELSGI